VTINNVLSRRQSSARSVFQITPDLQTELIRKSLHMLIALIPAIATVIGASGALTMLAAGTVFYTYAETLRKRGGSVFIVSRVTMLAARPRDAERFVLGPVTLGLGAMLALILYPAPAASLAIYALAFGDGLASLAGKAFGSIRIPGTRGKTLEGFAVGFAAVFVIALAFYSNPWFALTVAGAAALIELIPAGDADNIILPTFVGLLASQIPM
jgi:dolichol kinase